jgi:hypothetical protein
MGRVGLWDDCGTKPASPASEGPEAAGTRNGWPFGGWFPICARARAFQTAGSSASQDGPAHRGSSSARVPAIDDVPAPE